MSALDWVVLITMIVLFIAAALYLIFGKRSGCSGDCASCKGCAREPKRMSEQNNTENMENNVEKENENAI